MDREPDLAGSAAVGVLVSQLRRKGWIGAQTGARLAQCRDLRAMVLQLESERAITPATARTLLRTAFGETPQKFDGPETQGVERLHGTSADREATGYIDLGSKPLSSNEAPHPRTYMEIIAAHIERLEDE